MKKTIFIVLLSFSLITASFAQSKDVVKHRVKWYETLGMISKKYDVPEERILKYNNMMPADIKTNVLLLVPMGDQAAEPLSESGEDDIDSTGADEEIDQSNSKDVTTSDNETVVPVEEIEQKLVPVTFFTKENPFRISLVLPFISNSGTPSTNNMDFYCGALMAVSDAKQTGAHIHLDIYDLSTGSGNILSDISFSNSDLIIGPVEAGAIGPFANTAKEHCIPFVSPMDHKANIFLEGNPFFLQIPVPEEIQTANLIKTMSLEKGDKVTVFYNSEASAKEQAFVDQIRSILRSNNIAFNDYSYDLLNGRTLGESLAKGLSRNENHKIIVASEDEAFASDIVRNMKVMGKADVPVEIFCSNRLRNFESIDSDSFYELSAHISAPYYIDYSDTATHNFVLRYRALFNTEPTPFAFQGYDIFSYFISITQVYGDHFLEHISQYPMSMLQCNILFKKENGSEGGYVNSATRNLLYQPDFTISLK